MTAKVLAKKGPRRVHPFITRFNLVFTVLPSGCRNPSHKPQLPPITIPLKNICVYFKPHYKPFVKNETTMSLIPKPYVKNETKI